MRIAGFLAASVFVAASAPAPGEEWRLFHRERKAAVSEVGYADVASIARSGRTIILSVRSFAQGRMPPRAASLAMRLEIDCMGRRIRALEARPLDADDRLTHEIPIDKPDYQPIAHPAMQALARLVCDGDRSGSEPVPTGTGLKAHAAAALAALTPPPPPEPPPLTAEQAEALANQIRARKLQGFESVIRRALVAQCGSDLRCRQLESESHRGVKPVVGVEDLQCAESRRDTFGRASCTFAVRHSRTQRRLSCTVELEEKVGPHWRYWSYLTIRPPVPKSSSGIMVPHPGESSLRCSGSLLALVSD